MKEKDEIQLSDHFTYGRLFRFVTPSVIMVVYISLYGMVDGFFVSNFTGKVPFAAISLIMPAVMIVGSIGFMFGAGGNAFVAQTLGEGDRERANRYFSMIIIVTTAVGIGIAIIGNLLLLPLAQLLGATEEMMPYCISYGRIMIMALPFFMLDSAFQGFLVTAEKPKLGLWITVGVGLVNVVLDWLFIVVFDWGTAGAASATFLAEVLGALLPAIYFLTDRKATICLVKTNLEWKIIGKSIVNGSSEFVSNIAVSVVSIAYNAQLIRYAGPEGVAAYGVIMYAGFIFVAILAGYSMGVEPITAYEYGAGDYKELKNMVSKSIWINLIGGFVICALSVAFARYMAMIFVGYDDALMKMTVTGLRIYSLSAIFMGLNMWSSSFFTSLGDGKTSAILSFLRTLVLELAAVMIIPALFGITGIWFSIDIAEGLSLIVTSVIFVKNGKKYGYM